MALALYNRVQETTTTTGTGTITLAGAVAGFQSFAVIGNGNTTYYCITSGTAWEVGLGTYASSGTTLARTTVYSNSLGTTSPISLTGTSNVFVTLPAEQYPGTTYTRTAFTATAAQTSFSVTYTIGIIQVYINGVLLNASDYTATNGTTVVISVACASGDIVEFIAFNATNLTGTSRTVTDFTATAAQTTFTVTYTPGFLDVYRNGVKLATADYTATNGTSVVLGVACASGDVVQFVAFNIISLTGTSRTVTDSTATASQTTFGVIYTPGFLDVYRNGSKLAAADYTATNGTSVVFASGCTSGDTIQFVAYSPALTGTAINPINQNSSTISSNTTITDSQNGVSAGPITISNGVITIVQNGSRWVIL